MPKNVTVQVGDELVSKMEKLPDINWSQVMRNCLEEYCSSRLPSPETKGELMEGLHNFLSEKLPTTDKDKEKAREEEIARFRKKWGTLDSKGNDEEPSHKYVTILKTQEVKLGEQTVELQISNSRVLTSLRGLLEKGFGKYDINLYEKNLELLIEYFKSKDFTIAEENLLQTGVMHHVLKTYGAKGREQWRELTRKGYQYFGLFAADKEDRVFIAYREVRPK